MVCRFTLSKTGLKTQLFLKHVDEALVELLAVVSKRLTKLKTVSLDLIILTF